MIMKLIYILSALSILLLSESALACSNPTDSFASEVLLNKAGIAYDLTDIKNSKNVTLQNDAVIYRSHYNPEVAVALIVNNHLSIKVQIPTKQVQMKLPIVRVKAVGSGDIASMNVDVAKELGWNVRVSGKAFLGDISRDSYSLEKGDIRISLMPEGRMSLEKTEAEAIINNATVLTADVKKEVDGVLVKIGFSEETLQNAIVESKMQEWDDLAPSVNVDASVFNFSEGMKNELIWLRDNGVISGLTDADIDGIAKEAKKGAAGYNSRIVYFKGKWLSYRSTGQPLIKSASGCGGFPSAVLPIGMIANLGSGNSGEIKNTSQEYKQTESKPDLQRSGETKETPQAPGFELFSGIIALMLVLIKMRY
jgi:hypothetical protein